MKELTFQVIDILERFVSSRKDNLVGDSDFVSAENKSCFEDVPGGSVDVNLDI